MVDSMAGVRPGARQIKQIKDAGPRACLWHVERPRTPICADMARHPGARRSGDQSFSLLPPMYVLNFYSPVFIDQLKRGRKTATIRLGDKSMKYKKGEVVMVTVGFQHSPREKIFEAVIDSVDVKPVKELSPRDIEHDNPEFRRTEETVHFMEQIYGRSVSEDDLVTVVRFSAIVERPSEISDRLRPQAPAQN